MRYICERWQVDLTKREVRFDQGLVPVGGRAFDVLEILVRAAGEVVTKSELLDRVWPGAIVGENALQVHISALRRAFGTDREMIKTVSGRGYSLTGNWKLQEQESAVARSDTPIRNVGRAIPSSLPEKTSDLIGRATEVQQLRDRL